MVPKDSESLGNSSQGPIYPSDYENLQKQLDNHQKVKLAKVISQYDHWLVAAEAKTRELSAPPLASDNHTQTAAGPMETTVQTIRDPMRDSYGLLIEPAPDLEDLQKQLNEDLRGELDLVLFDYYEKCKQANTRLREIDVEHGLRKVRNSVQDVEDEGVQDTARIDQGSTIPNGQQPATSSMYNFGTPDQSIPIPIKESPRGSTSASTVRVYPRIGINPTLIAIPVDMYLKHAADILSVPKQSVNKIDAAHNNVCRAEGVAKRIENEPLLARCEFYYGLISFRRGSIRSAVHHFKDSTGANWENSTYPERKWAHQWIAECEWIIETRGEVSKNSTPIASPTGSCATDDGNRKPRPRNKRKNRQESGGQKSYEFVY